ncbi:TPA: phage tail protein [Pseudomonas aeruginosa]|nr:phage tail protein [Pseudomonas aeruginosa]
MPWYSTGTVSVVLNSDTVTGSGTAFSANARAGDAFRGPDGRWYEIGNIASATVLTIKPAYQGASATGQAYSITPVQGYPKALADQFRDLNNQWGSLLAAVKPWAIASTGSQAQADMGISAVGRALNNASTPANALSYLGGVAPNQMGWAGNAVNTADLDSLTVSGLYAHGTTVPSPVNNAQGYVVHMQHGNPDFAVQQWYQLNSTTGQYMRIKTAGGWSRWMLQYNQVNIIGQVSFDASSNPNGALFQSGSSANGNYVRFADGTQITRTRIIGSRATGPHSITIAAAFTTGQDTAVFVNWVPGTNWPANPGNGIRGIYLSSGSVVTFYLNDAMGANDSLVITAIGRWRA